jgi:hypothetical protein
VVKLYLGVRHYLKVPGNVREPAVTTCSYFRGLRFEVLYSIRTPHVYFTNNSRLLEGTWRRSSKARETKRRPHQTLAYSRKTLGKSKCGEAQSDQFSKYKAKEPSATLQENEESEKSLPVHLKHVTGPAIIARAAFQDVGLLTKSKFRRRTAGKSKLVTKSNLAEKLTDARAKHLWGQRFVAELSLKNMSSRGTVSSRFTGNVLVRYCWRRGLK